MAKGPKAKVTDQIRRLVETCGLTRYRIAKLTGIDESALTRFMSGERGLSAKALDKLGEVLRLEVIMHGPQAVKERKAK